jgi:hypothetical protein
MAAGAAAAVPRPSRRGSWRTQLARLLEDALHSIDASPGLASRLPRAFLTPAGLELSEAGMAILLEAGFSRAAAASAWRALWSYTYGFAMFRVESHGSVRAAVAVLPEGSYPALASAGDELAAALADDGEFGAGLAKLLDGLEGALRAG